MIEATTEALQAMAGRVAAQLVAEALKGMVSSAVTVTLHPVVGQGIVQAPRLLGPAASPRNSSPAKRRGRKPGRKPKTAKTAKVAKVAKVRKVKTPSTASPAVRAFNPLADKRCRGCMRVGTAVLVSGKHVKCTHCKHEWDIRGGGAIASAVSPEPSRCTRCDHTEGEHDPQTGKCLSVRCSCAGFWK